jgi:hypothetical protein
MKRHQIKMLQTEVGLDKRKEVGLAGLFFWHQLVHYYSALMAHFSTGVDKQVRTHRAPGVAPMILAWRINSSFED